jgi:hypothetical protein
MLIGDLRENPGYALDKPFGGLNRRARSVEWHICSRPQLVVRYRFHVIRLWQETAQLCIEARFVSGQSRKFGVNTFVGLSIFARARGDESLRGMKGRKVGIAASILADTGGQNDPRAGQTLMGLIEMIGSFRRHKSTPSRRISRISDVRS